jgi:hypothetical protein
MLQLYAAKVNILGNKHHLKVALCRYRDGEDERFAPRTLGMEPRKAEL